MTSLVIPAKELHRIHQQAEASYHRGAYPATVHDVYVTAYVEAVVVERHRVHEQETK